MYQFDVFFARKSVPKSLGNCFHFCPVILTQARWPSGRKLAAYGYGCFSGMRKHMGAYGYAPRWIHMVMVSKAVQVVWLDSPSPFADAAW